MRIIYPHNQRLMARRAHDILVVKTCHALASMGHEVFLITGKTHSSTETILEFYGLDKNPYLHIIQLPILRRAAIPRISWHFIFDVFCLKEILVLKKRINPDLIYLSEIKLAAFLFRFKKVINLSFIYEIHGLYAKEYRVPLKREWDVFSSSDVIITTLNELKKKLIDIYKITCPVFKVPLAASSLGATMRYTDTVKMKRSVFYIGQFYPLQGVDVLIRAAAYLPEWIELHLVGGRKEEIERLALLGEQLRIRSRIIFHGFLPHGAIVALMEQADILTIPSLAQGKMPYVAHTKIYEYMAAGKPIVASDMPSVREELEDGINGILVRAGDPYALAEGIMKVLNDPGLESELSRNAFEKSKEYTWQKRAERLTEIFRKAMAK